MMYTLILAIILGITIITSIAVISSAHFKREITIITAAGFRLRSISSTVKATYSYYYNNPKTNQIEVATEACIHDKALKAAKRYNELSKAFDTTAKFTKLQLSNSEIMLNVLDELGI